jgi:hypothetical protein
MWWSTRHSSTAYASPSSLGFSGFTSVVTLSSSSTKSWKSRTTATLAWWHIEWRLGGWRKSSTVLSSIISFDETMKWPTPSLGSGRAMNKPLRECSHMTYTSPPFDLRRTSRRSCQDPHWVRTTWYLWLGPRRVKAVRPRLSRLTWGPRPGQLVKTGGGGLGEK